MKRFIKNNLKVFVAVIISGIVFTGIGVYAASQYFAKDISFTPTNENFKKENDEPINNVEDALNALYNKSKCSSGVIHHKSNEQININLGYKPSIFYASYYWPTLDMNLYLTYDKNVDSNIYLNYVEKQSGLSSPVGPTIVNYNTLVSINNNGIETNFVGRSLALEYDFYYVACK